jgi:hypothetical protein
VVRIGAPGNNARVARNILVRASATGVSAVTRMQLTVDGFPRGTVSGSRLAVAVRRLARGRHMLVVRAFDARGNAGSRAVRVRVR